MKLFFTKKVILLTLTILAVHCSFAQSRTVVGYKITSGEKGVAVNCYDEDKKVGDQSLCEQYSTLKNSSCDLILSTNTYDYDDPIYMCNPPGESYCFRDSDCKILGKGTCVTKQGSLIKFEEQFDDDTDFVSNTEKIGICSSIGGSAESNAFGQAICNLITVVNGNAGRAVVGVVVIVVGVMFFLGKVTWSLVLAIALGAGGIFGAQTIVLVVTGKPFYCN